MCIVEGSGNQPVAKADVEKFNMEVDGIDNVSVFSLVSLFYLCFIGEPAVQ